MFGLSKREKEQAAECKRIYDENIKKLTKLKEKYYSLIGSEVKVGLNIYGIIDGVEKNYMFLNDNVYYDDRDDEIVHTSYMFNIRILSSKNDMHSKNKVFEYVVIPCSVILKLNEHL